MAISVLPSQETIIRCQNTLLEWAESMDTKDWPRLASTFAPTVSVDYSSLNNGPVIPSLPAKQLIANLSKPDMLGSETLQTQHFIGATKWSFSPSDNDAQAQGSERVRSDWQLRAAHRRVSKERNEEDGTEREKEVATATIYGANKMEFEEVEKGQWKIVSIAVSGRWIEGDFEGTFKPKDFSF